MSNIGRGFNIKLKNPAAPASRHQSSRLKPEDQVYSAQRGNYGRVIGRAKRSYGQVNLKVDPSKFLSPCTELKFDVDSLASNKLTHDLDDLADTKKGCIVWYTLEYFETSNNVKNYVDVLLLKCLVNDYIIDKTTLNFLLLTNIISYGESIKREMFKSLQNIHEDLLSFNHKSTSRENHPLFLTSYNHSVAVNYYKLVGLLFFRFRKHLDSYKRYKPLVQPVFCGLNYLLKEGSLESLKLFTRLNQLNFHALEIWLDNDIIQLVNKVRLASEHYKLCDKIKWTWLSGVLKIISEGPILSRPMYSQYLQALGPEWSENVIYPPVPVLDRISKFIIEEKLDSFHIDDGDVIRNMFVYLP